MPILIFAAPMTGRTWLADELNKHGIKTVDMDAVMADTIRKHNVLNTNHLPIVGMPNWFERVKKATLDRIPADALVYIGGSSVFPIMPPFFASTPHTKLFLEIGDLEKAYRRLFMPYLPPTYQNVPVIALKMVLSAILDDDSRFPFYETFARHYNLLREQCHVRMTADEIIGHLRRVFS